MKQPAEPYVVQNNDVVEEFAPQGADKALGEAVHVGHPHRGADDAHARREEKPREAASIARPRRTSLIRSSYLDARATAFIASTGLGNSGSQPANALSGGPYRR
jgi:hypothetical protein